MRFDLRGFIENSLLEWEDHLAAVVIAGGCNLRCPFCHSWRYVTGLDDLERLDPSVVFHLLERQRGWIDGVVFTGGEPTLQPDLPEFILRVREYGVETKLHTNGTRPDVIENLLNRRLLDCLALDYKAPLDARYFAAAGVPESGETLAAVRRSFILAADAGIEVEYHTTLDPEFVTPEAFSEMAAALPAGGRWILQQYETGDCLNPGLAGTARYDGERLEAFLREAESSHGRALLKKGSSA